MSSFVMYIQYFSVASEIVQVRNILLLFGKSSLPKDKEHVDVIASKDLIDSIQQGGGGWYYLRMRYDDRKEYH